MAGFSTSKRLQQYQFFSPALRKFPSSSFSSFRFSLSFPPTKHTFSQFLQVNARLTHLDTKLELSKKTRNGRIIDKTGSGFSSVRPKDKRVDREFVENNVSSVVEENRYSRREIGSGYSSVTSKDNNFTKNVLKTEGFKSVSQKKMNKITKKGGSSQLKFVKNMPKTDGIERVGMKMEGIERVGMKMDKFSKKNESSQLKFAKNVVKMEGNERVGKKTDKISNKGESSHLKFANNVPKTEGIERVSKKVDKISKKGESSQLKFAKNVQKTEGIERVSKKMDKTSKKGENSRIGVEKWGIGGKKMKTDAPGYVLRLGLDMCSKRGDFMGGIRVYDLAKREGVKMGQYHYTVLLYLCSSAATRIIQPAKSGSRSGSRSLSLVDSSNEGSDDLDEIGKMGKTESESVPENCEEMDKMDSNQSSNGSTEMGVQTLEGFVRLMYAEQSNVNRKSYGIEVSEDVKTYALKRGFEIYEEMVLEKVPMNEATLTSLARMAMSMGNGDMAFDMVKQMKELGINPRLRSYGPALSIFCNNGDIEKAFVVEEHMLAHGVYPEESELEALMKVSVEASRSDKVYYLLHKLRTSVRKVLPSTANLIEKWFCSRTASRVGKRKWDQSLITKAIENGGGGWHGQGWLGKGKSNVVRTYVGADGFCKGCGEKLVTIDLDPTETENFAESVAKIAKDRDTNSSFQKFQKWLDYYGPFEAVVDAANVGLYSQRTFTPSKVNSIAEGIRQMLPSKKWPLIVLHNRRITGGKMNKGVNKILIEKWKNANALYATPTGSNDDWYWLYAAIKFKCLLVTNDKMRDHLFQLLGNDFFPKWKERHQVRFTFSDTGLEFCMPPPCSVVIQESEKGHWHIPIVSEEGSEGERMWLCITRPQTDKAKRDSTAIDGGTGVTCGTKKPANLDSATETQLKLPGTKHSNHRNQKEPPREIDTDCMNPMPSSPLINQITIQPQIEAGEKLGGRLIDFQI